jgi:environmental stress-induced protein Ves
MTNLIKSNDYKIMPWKNGLGITSEIEIDPKNSNFPNDDFLWRLSSAKIQAPNSFSNFSGYDRILIVWSGSGLILNQHKLVPLVPYKFKGEDLIECSLIADEVLDLGLIYKRGVFKAEMSVVNFLKSENPHQLILGDGIHFLFCVQGQLIFGDQKIESMDTLKIQGPIKIQILNSDSNSTVVAICIHVEINLLSL